MNNNRLINLGFDEEILQKSALYQDLYLGRVIAQYKDLYKVATALDEVTAEISGKFRYLAADLPDYPAVGDFVMVDKEHSGEGNVIIHKVLPRKSIFVRKAAGTAGGVQVVAANIDIVFICMSLNNDFNLRRLERYLSIAWDSQALPVIVLTKSDLCGDIDSKLAEIYAVAAGVDVLITTSMTDKGYEAIKKYITPGKTVAFIGSSGVGKSTLINRLLGEEVIKTGELRNDDRGRHTTTRRELILIPSGGAVIDTPGMRELGIETANLSKSFSEIEELATQCKFRDCTHTDEPGCAVNKAVEDGLLSRERVLSFQKLKKEAKYEGLNSRQIEKEKINEMFSGFAGMKNARNFIKSKNRRKR